MYKYVYTNVPETNIALYVSYTLKKLLKGGTI